MGPVSRAQIARDSDLSKPTVSQALASLLEAGLVREAGRASGKRGPAAILYELNPRAGWVVGIDIGRAWVRAAIANLSGDIVARRDERTMVKSQRALITQIGQIAHGLAAEAHIRWRQVTFATVGSPGVFHPAKGTVELAYALPGWGRSGLVETVQEELGTKIAFENDVNLAALGEQWRGLGKNVANFAYLHVGTGVGAGLVLNGELFRGHAGAAGEVGYLPLATEDPRNAVSRRLGALDAAAGARGVVAAARAFGMSGPLSAKRVFAAARRGDPVAQRVVELEARSDRVGDRRHRAGDRPRARRARRRDRQQRGSPAGACRGRAGRDLPLPPSDRGVGARRRGRPPWCGRDGAPGGTDVALRARRGIRRSREQEMRDVCTDEMPSAVPVVSGSGNAENEGRVG